MFHLFPIALAEEAAAAPSWTQTAVKKLVELPAAMWGILAALVVLGAVLLMMNRSNTKWTAQMLANASLSIALAFVLSCIRLYKMPQGGSITLASMLPIFLFAYAYGTAPGLFVGMAYGFLQWMQDGFYMLTPVEGVMDYLLAYTVLGLCGIASHFGQLSTKVKLTIGMVIGVVARAVVAITAGYIFFGEYAPAGQAPIIYSMSYNGLYLIPDTAICLLIAIPAGERLLKLMRKK